LATGFCLARWGSLQCSPDPLLALKGGPRKGEGEGDERKKERWVVRKGSKKEGKGSITLSGLGPPKNLIWLWL